MWPALDNCAKFRFHEKKFCFVRSGGATFRPQERNFISEEFVADYRMQANAAVIITSCIRTCTCKLDNHLKKKPRNDCYNCGENLRQNRAILTRLVSLVNTCISAISLKLSIAWYIMQNKFCLVIKENSSNYSEFLVALFNYFTCMQTISIPK